MFHGFGLAWGAAAVESLAAPWIGRFALLRLPQGTQHACCTQKDSRVDVGECEVDLPLGRSLRSRRDPALERGRGFVFPAGARTDGPAPAPRELRPARGPSPNR